jgi:hypothetical protein
MRVFESNFFLPVGAKNVKLKMKMISAIANQQFLKRLGLVFGSLVFLSGVELSAYQESINSDLSVHNLDLSQSITDAETLIAEGSEESDHESRFAPYIPAHWVSVPEATLLVLFKINEELQPKTSGDVSSQDSRAPPII